MIYLIVLCLIVSSKVLMVSVIESGVAAEESIQKLKEKFNINEEFCL